VLTTKFIETYAAYDPIGNNLAVKTMQNHNSIPVVDLFAGPGGLGEGFSAFKKHGYGHPFKIAMSVEMDTHAHQTLRMRSFYRQYKFNGLDVPKSYYKVLRGDADESLLRDGPCSRMWQRADNEAIQAQLGTSDGDELAYRRISDLKLAKHDGPTVLLGGPPCQAYSLVGRARNRGVRGYRAEKDHRHVLYQEYLSMIRILRPAVFVMENVKGLLSSKLNQKEIFPRILDDLRFPHTKSSAVTSSDRYELFALACDNQDTQSTLWNEEDPRSFLIRCEEYGVPQRRHRVFVIGIREGMGIGRPKKLVPSEDQVSIQAVLNDLPATLPGVSSRSGMSNLSLDSDVCSVLRSEVTESILKDIGRGKKQGAEVEAVCRRVVKRAGKGKNRNLDDFLRFDFDNSSRPTLEYLSDWYWDQNLEGVCNHVAKSHMPSDLVRYLFVSAYGKVNKKSPKLSDFPRSLLPNHKNAQNGKAASAAFADRFRVQINQDPATTVTSHISKDGHYFIHPDPEQFRSLTVREAARIQTFPDNYLFCGPRTAQYHQVGNAVPPYIAYQIAQVIFDALKGS
jgi:DNA (cytosine-5)-methyltransferase 1